MSAHSTLEPFTSATSEASHVIKVLPIEDGWCVAVGRGHYAQPLSKQEAIFRAAAIARSMQVTEIGVYGDGELLETIAC